MVSAPSKSLPDSHLRLGARALGDTVVEGRAGAAAAVRAGARRSKGMDMRAGGAREGSSTVATDPGSPMGQAEGLATLSAPAGRRLRAASLRAAMRARSSAVRDVSKVEDLSLGTSVCQSPPCEWSSKFGH